MGRFGLCPPKFSSVARRLCQSKAAAAKAEQSRQAAPRERIRFAPPLSAPRRWIHTWGCVKLGTMRRAVRLARLIYIFLGTNSEPLELCLAGGHRQLPARYRGCTQSPVWREENWNIWPCWLSRAIHFGKLLCQGCCDHQQPNPAAWRCFFQPRLERVAPRPPASPCHDIC